MSVFVQPSVLGGRCCANTTSLGVLDGHCFANIPGPVEAIVYTASHNSTVLDPNHIISRLMRVIPSIIKRFSLGIFRACTATDWIIES